MYPAPLNGRRKCGELAVQTGLWPACLRSSIPPSMVRGAGEHRRDGACAGSVMSGRGVSRSSALVPESARAATDLARPDSADVPASRRRSGPGLGKGRCVAATARTGATTGSTANAEDSGSGARPEHRRHTPVPTFVLNQHAACATWRQEAHPRRRRRAVRSVCRICPSPPPRERETRSEPVSESCAEWRGRCGHAFSNRRRNP